MDLADFDSTDSGRDADGRRRLDLLLGIGKLREGKIERDGNRKRRKLDSLRPEFTLYIQYSNSERGDVTRFPDLLWACFVGVEEKTSCVGS